MEIDSTARLVSPHPRFAIAIRIQCPSPECRATCSAADTVSGRPVKCPKCGKTYVAKPTLDGQISDTKNRSATNENPLPDLPAEFGRYRVLKLLGKGGMGAVYLAQDSQLGREVALKIPFFDATQSQRLERFAREARSAAVLHHPNICTVFDSGEIDGRPFITMAYIAGTPLEQEIDPDSPMSQPRAAQIVRQVALALEYAHRKGIVHRDLKPANIMMSADGEPVVMDFGLAKQVVGVDPNESKLTRDGGILGTPTYMSPEQVKGDIATIGPTTDVYALGVMLFEMLTGKPPYIGAMGVVMAQILMAPVPPLREFRPSADTRLEAICQRAMAKTPADRFQSMAELVDALDMYLKAPSESPVPTPEAKRVPPSSAPVVSPPPYDELDDVPAPVRTSKKAKKATRAKKTKPNWQHPALLVLLVVALLIPLGVWLAVTLLRVETPNGTLVVEINDPNVEARIKNGKLILSGPDGKDRYTLTPSERDKKIDTGSYKIRVEGADGLMLDTSEFTLKKGGKVTVRVTMEQKVVAKKEPDKAQRKSSPLAEATDLVPPFKGKDDTIKLFDGKTLDGWEGYSDLWSVKDGVIVAKNTEPLSVSTYLLTKKKYSDFRLTFAAKLVQSEMHSGVCFWGTVKPDVSKDPEKDRTKYTYAGHLVMFPSGWGMYDLFGRNGLAVDGGPAKKVGKQHDWNDIEILAQGNRVRVAVNGTAVVDWRDPQPERIKEGPIGLQLHSNNVPQEIHFKGLVLETFPKEDKLLTVK